MTALPAMAPWAAVGVPITDVTLMAGRANRRRSRTRNGSGIADNFAMVGDSSIYTNATVGQRVALGFRLAQSLARAGEHVTHAIMTSGIPALLGGMAAGGDDDAARLRPTGQSAH